MTSSSTYIVTGMTCSHCVHAVIEEVSQIPGVTDVHVDLDSGLVNITSESPVERPVVAAAVDEAGYELLD